METTQTNSPVFTGETVATDLTDIARKSQCEITIAEIREALTGHMFDALNGGPVTRSYDAEDAFTYTLHAPAAGVWASTDARNWFYSAEMNGRIGEIRITDSDVFVVITGSEAV